MTGRRKIQLSSRGAAKGFSGRAAARGEETQVADRNSTHSTLRERIVEHVFVGEALRRLWQRNVIDVEVLRSEFDAHGYDLVLSRGHVVRHIQFKTGQKKPRNVTVPLQLADKPSGCVVW